MVGDVYKLKDDSYVTAIEIGRSSVKIGEKSKNGYLEVLDRGPAPTGKAAYVICKCKCGNFVNTRLNEIRTGSTLSCGCYNKEILKEQCRELGKRSYYKDYTKVDNPFYIFIEPTERKDNDGTVYWKIQCKNCGKFYEERPVFLVSDYRRKGNNPCNCWRNSSKGEIKITNILDDNNISYERQKTYSDCLTEKGNCFKFDFYLKDKNTLIEYDGEQHFRATPFGSDFEHMENNFEVIKQYDKIKNKYCLNNHITLIRIPYTHYNHICLEDLMPETSKFIIKEEDNNE